MCETVVSVTSFVEPVLLNWSLNGYWLVCHFVPCLVTSISSWHGISSGCRLRKQPPDMEGSCEYTE